MPADIESLASQVTAQLEGGTTSSPAPAEAGSGTADGGSALTPSPAPAPAPATAPMLEAPTPAAPAPATETTKPEGATDPSVTPPPGPNEAPSSWKPEEKALWEGLPEQARAVILRREADFHKGYQAVRQSADTGQKFVETLQPFMAEIAQHRLDPFQVTRNLWAAQKALTLGTPEAKLAMFQQLAQDYQIDLRQVGGNPEDAPFVDQETVRLREQVTSLNNRIQSFEQQQFSTKQAAARQELDAFFADKTANEFVDKAADQMATLLTADKSLTLKDAYEKAIWMVPEIREILLGRQQAKARTEAEKALQAQKLQAASNVQVGVSPGSVTAPAENLSAEETAAAALRAMRANQRN